MYNVLYWVPHLLSQGGHGYCFVVCHVDPRSNSCWFSLPAPVLHSFPTSLTRAAHPRALTSFVVQLAFQSCYRRRYAVLSVGSSRDFIPLVAIVQHSGQPPIWQRCQRLRTLRCMPVVCGRRRTVAVVVYVAHMFSFQSTKCAPFPCTVLCQLRPVPNLTLSFSVHCQLSAGYRFLHPLFCFYAGGRCSWKCALGAPRLCMFSCSADYVASNPFIRDRNSHSTSKVLLGALQLSFSERFHPGNLVSHY
jgi:hypothetical protein